MPSNRIMLMVFRTQLEMVEARGFVVPNELKAVQSETYSVLKFTSKFVNENGGWSNLNHSYKHKTNDSYLLYFYAFDPIPSVNDIRAFISFVALYKENKVNVACAVLVSEQPMAMANIRLLKLKNITDPSTLYQTYIYDELFFNPTRHVLVPKHRLLSSEEQDELYKSMKGTLVDPRPMFRSDARSHALNVMPTLYVQNIHGGNMTKTTEIGDPIAKWYMARPSDVFEITRKNFFADTTVSESITYRYVL